MFKVLAVDPSINSLGWAILREDQVIIDGGVIQLSEKEKQLPVSQRLMILVQSIARVIKFYKLSSEDYVVCESQPRILNARNALILERVRGAIEGVSLMFNLKVLGRINPRSLHLYLFRHRKQLCRAEVKNQIRAFVRKQFKAFFLQTIDSETNSQDLYDAVALGYYFVNLLKKGRGENEFKQYLSDY